MAKRMTKEQRADELIRAARCWQNQEDRISYLWNVRFGRVPSDHLCEIVWGDFLDRWINLDICASAALSEVCHGMGFDIE